MSGSRGLATSSRNDRKQRPHFLAWIRSAHDAAHDRNADRAGCPFITRAPACSRSAALAHGIVGRATNQSRIGGKAENIYSM
jgi:hypothetical protein